MQSISGKMGDDLTSGFITLNGIWTWTSQELPQEWIYCNIWWDYHSESSDQTCWWDTWAQCFFCAQCLNDPKLSLVASIPGLLPPLWAAFVSPIIWEAWEAVPVRSEPRYTVPELMGKSPGKPYRCCGLLRHGFLYMITAKAIHWILDIAYFSMSMTILIYIYTHAESHYQNICRYILFVKTNYQWPHCVFTMVRLQGSIPSRTC